MSTDGPGQRAAAAPGDWPLLALFAPPLARARVSALAAVLAELGAVTDAPHAAELALTRLTWWREELARLAAGEPRHPLTRAWHAADGPAPDAQLLGELVDGVLDDLEGPRAVDDDAWALWRYRRGGAPLALALAAAGCRWPERNAFELGGTLHELITLTELPAALARGRVCLPPDAPEPAAFRARTPETGAWLTARLAALADQLSAHRQALAGSDRTATTAWVALALGEQRLAHLRRQLPALPTGTHPHPLRRVLRAWAAATFRR